jgi:hypothetical protein
VLQAVIFHNEHNEEKTSLLKVQGEDLDQAHVTIEAMKALYVCKGKRECNFV